jgi:hypothetical protein
MATKGQNKAQDRRRQRRRFKNLNIGGNAKMLGNECRANWGGGLHRARKWERNTEE